MARAEPREWAKQVPGSRLETNSRTRAMCAKSSVIMRENVQIGKSRILRRKSQRVLNIKRVKEVRAAKARRT